MTHTDLAAKPSIADHRQLSFDWSGARFMPVALSVEPGRVILSAGGESVALAGELFGLDADGPLDAKWSIEDREFAVVSLSLRAERPTLLRQVAWLPGTWEPAAQQHVHSTALQDIALFLRRGQMSFFVSLDFPFSRITEAGVSYPPHEMILPGRDYACHTLTVGACRLSGGRVGDMDRAEIEAVSAYVERRFPMRFERPLFVSACITNRMTDCRDGVVFYSMHDNPTLSLSPRLLEEDVRLCGELGIEYLQVFEGVFDWLDPRKTGAALERIVRLGKRVGVRIGDYVNPQGLYCWHYNYQKRSIGHPEWRQNTADGKQGNYCLGCRDYVESFRPQLIEHNRRYGEELICFDFLGVGPCHHPDHGHPVGDVYQQVRNLVAIFNDLQALSPNYLVWSNSGNWLELMPKLVWRNPNVYLTDPHVREYAPNLNALKFLGDGRREQMVSVHNSHFVPFRAFTNCEYYAFPRSRVPDVRVFEYSFLQGLAVTPNICPAEVRTFFNRISGPQRTHCAGFMREWMSLIRRNFAAWKHTAIAGDAPDLGAIEVYGHFEADRPRGFVCLVNQNPFPRVARVRLDGTIGLVDAPVPPHDAIRFELHEIYPRRCPLAEQPLPFASRGDQIALIVPPQSIRFIEVIPVSDSNRQTLAVFGLPAKVRAIRGGYRVAMRAPQGECVTVGLVCPSGLAVASVRARQTPTVPVYTFEASARLLEQQGSAARVEVQFPRGRAPRALSRWTVSGSGGETEVDLPALGRSGFLGGLVSGAFSEEHEVQLDVLTTPCGEPGELPALPAPSPAATADVPVAGRQIFSTRFELPFIEPPAFGCMKGFDDDVVVELAFVDPAAVAEIQARINGKAVEVRRYSYPRKPDWHSFYVELTGQVAPGPIELVVDITWRSVGGRDR